MAPGALSPTRWSRGELLFGVVVAGVGGTLVATGRLFGAVLAALVVGRRSFLGGRLGFDAHPGSPTRPSASSS